MKRTTIRQIFHFIELLLSAGIGALITLIIYFAYLR